MELWGFSVPEVSGHSKHIEMYANNNTKNKKLFEGKKTNSFLGQELDLKEPGWWELETIV